MYFYIFILCVNTITSMINTNAFFDITDFQHERRHGFGVAPEFGPSCRVARQCRGPCGVRGVGEKSQQVSK